MNFDIGFKDWKYRNTLKNEENNIDKHNIGFIKVQDEQNTNTRKT